MDFATKGFMGRDLIIKKFPQEVGVNSRDFGRLMELCDLPELGPDQRKEMQSVAANLRLSMPCFVHRKAEGDGKHG